MQSLTDTPGLQTSLSQIAEIDEKIRGLNDQIDALKEQRGRLEELVIEDMTTQRLDGVKAAGRSWRIEWSHSFSAPEARKEVVMDAARRAGLLEMVTQVNTAKLKAWLTEQAKEAGTDPRQAYSDGTEFEGLVGEYVRPVLRSVSAK